MTGPIPPPPPLPVILNTRVCCPRCGRFLLRIFRTREALLGDRCPQCRGFVRIAASGGVVVATMTTRECS